MYKSLLSARSNNTPRGHVQSDSTSETESTEIKYFPTAGANLSEMLTLHNDVQTSSHSTKSLQ